MTLDFEPRYALWERAPSYAGLGGGGAGAVASRVFNVTAVVRINQQSILYTPPVSEVLQAGWSKVGRNTPHVLFLFLWQTQYASAFGLVCSCLYRRTSET